MTTDEEGSGVRSWKARTVCFMRDLKLHTEPLVLLFSLCRSALSVVQPHLSEGKMQRTYQPPAGLDPIALKKFYNKKMVLWEQNYVYFNVPIACLFGIFWGAYSDRKGRKLPIILGIFNNFLDCLVRTLVWWDMVDLDLNWLLVDGMVIGFLGGTQMTLVNAYLVDKFQAKTLSIRMILFSAVFSVGSLLGVQLASLSVRFLGHIPVLFGIQLVLVLAMLLGICVLDNDVPQKSQQQQELEAEPDRSQTSLLSILSEGINSFRDCFRIFARSHQAHGRLLLCLCFLLNFLDQMIFSEESDLIGIYTRLPPFYWDTQQYAQYKTFRPVAQLLGMVFGMVVLKQLLRMRDILVIVMAILSMGAAALVIGLASSSTLIYLSLVAGSLHGLLNPIAYTFLASLVFKDEIGKTFALTTIASRASAVAQSVVLQNIYKWTVDWYQGFIWMLLAGLSLISALTYAVVGYVCVDVAQVISE